VTEAFKLNNRRWKKLSNDEIGILENMAINNFVKPLKFEEVLLLS
jgi:hypothetical protein